MKKSPEIILQMLEVRNDKAFKFAKISRIVGIVLLISIVFLLEISSIRTICLVISLILMSLPFTFKFFIDEHKQIGLIKLLENESFDDILPTLLSINIKSLKCVC